LNTILYSKHAYIKKKGLFLHTLYIKHACIKIAEDSFYTPFFSKTCLYYNNGGLFLQTIYIPNMPV